MEGSNIKNKIFIGIVESLSNQISGLSNEKFEVDLKLQNKKQEYEDRDNECQSDRAGYE